MKKIGLHLVVIVLLIWGTLSNAQARGARTAFSLNLGVQTNFFGEDSFEHAWFTLDARFGIDVSQSLEISPEVMTAVYSSMEFDTVFLYPGLILNLKLGEFFVGAGAVLPLVFEYGDVDVYIPSPKLNFGYRAGNLILTAYFFTLIVEDVGFLEFNYIGATIGYRF
jgi:hypothetical protein